MLPEYATYTYCMPAVPPYTAGLPYTPVGESSSGATGSVSSSVVEKTARNSFRKRCYKRQQDPQQQQQQQQQQQATLPPPQPPAQSEVFSRTRTSLRLMNVSDISISNRHSMKLPTIDPLGSNVCMGGPQQQLHLLPLQKKQPCEVISPAIWERPPLKPIIDTCPAAKLLPQRGQWLSTSFPIS